MLSQTSITITFDGHDGIDSCGDVDGIDVDSAVK